MKLIFFHLVLASLVPLSVEAALSETLFGVSFDGANADARRKAAAELGVSFQRMLELIPNLKPSEREWLDAENQIIGELGITNVPITRLNRLFGSTEYHLDRLRNQISLISENLGQFESARTESSEIVVWWVVSFNLLKFDNTGEAFRKLGQEGLLPSDFAAQIGFLRRNDLGWDLSEVAATIQEKIIGPYLVKVAEKSIRETSDTDVEQDR